MSSEPSRSSAAHPSGDQLDAAVETIVRALVDAPSARSVVIIDGRSGAGKSSLASALVERWPAAVPAQLVALDDLYPGWEGLAAGAEYARAHVLVPYGRGDTGVWRRWDWAAGERAESHTVDPGLPLVVEGSGALSPASASLADIRVWVDAPADVRRTRALARDGDSYRPYWDLWAAQENAHVRAHDPVSLASIHLMLR